MSALIAGLASAFVAALALTVLALTAWRDRRRMAPPKLAAICMDFKSARRARFEIIIDHPAASPDWSIRRIEWLAPEGVAIAAGPDAPAADGAVDLQLAPRDADGRWFAGDPTLWARYGQDTVPVHEVKLRVTLERPGGRRQRLIVTSVFPAMNWRTRPQAVRAAAPARRPLFPLIDRTHAPAPARLEAGAPWSG